MSRLRKTLPEDVLVTRPPGYLLRVAETDARDFERLVEESEAQAPAHSSSREAQRAGARCIAKAKTAGRTNNVAIVEAASPPMTARPSAAA